MEDEKLLEWIRRDIAENNALSEFCDVDNALSKEKQKETAMLIPKFRIDGKTKKYKKAHKRKEVPTIPDARVAELKEMLQQVESLKDLIAKQTVALDKMKVSNARAHREILEGKQFLESLRTEVENKKLEHLQQLEEARVAEQKEKKELERRRRAQAKISEKSRSAVDEQKRMEEELKQLEASYTEFKATRDREKRQLERKIKRLRKENEVLTVEINGIEKQLAET